MSGRGLRAAGVAYGTALLLAGCAWGGGSNSSVAATTPAFGDSPPPPVGSIEHPRPVECIDGMTYATGPSTPPPPSSHPTPNLRDVIVGPLAWKGVREMATGVQSAYGYRNSDGWHYKVAPDVQAGAVVTVTIGSQQRASAGLEYGTGNGASPTPAVTFHSCPGAVTGFPGGFFVAGDGRACVPLDVRVADGPPRRVVISFFNGDCPA